MLDFTLSVAMFAPSRSTLRGAPSGGVLTAGSGSGTCERWRTQPRPRAVLGQPRRALGPGPVRPRSKAERPRCRVGAPQGAGRDASRPGPGDPGSSGNDALPDRSRVTWVMRLVARRPPRLRGRRKTAMRATPWPRAANRGRFSLPQYTSFNPISCSTIEYVNADRPHSPFVPAEAGPRLRNA